jgi:hypothetical protein
MKKYCLVRYHHDSKWYFIGKLIRKHDGKYDYWEGSSLTPNIGNCTWNNYLDAIFMKLGCLFATGRLYKISVVQE